MKCERCDSQPDSEDAPATMWCVECENSLCHDCYEWHKDWKDFESHRIVPITEFCQNPKQAVSTLVKSEMCGFHAEKTLDLYCKTCSSLICRGCTMKDHPDGHRDHEFDSVYRVVDKERERLKQVMAPMQQLLAQVQNGVLRMENCEKQVEIESEANIEKIRATYGEVYKLLKQQEEETVEKVNTIKASFKQTIVKKKENAMALECQLVSCNEFSEKVIFGYQTSQLLTYNKWIENRVDELVKLVENTTLDPGCKMIVNYRKPFEFVSDYSVCNVSCLPHLPDCAVEGPPVLYSDPVKVTVTLKDIFGSPVEKQSKDLEIYCSKEIDFLQNIQIKEESRGQYHVSYHPKRKENHLLTVCWRGFDVNHEEIKVLMNIRDDYSKLKQEVKMINKYGPTKKWLSNPYLLAKGPDNELIVRDNHTKQLVVFDKHFQYSHVIDGNFQTITGIAADKKRCLYTADRDLHHIQKFQMSGEYISTFGCQGAAAGQFQSPCGLALSQSELLFVCDSDNHRIQIFQNEKFRYCFGRHGTEPGTFDTPRDLTLNNTEDQLFITEKNNHRVQVFSPQGKFLQVFGNFTVIPFKLQQPVGIHYTPDGQLLISSCGTHCVLVFGKDGKFTSAIEGSYQGQERFSYPCGVVMMDNGQIVIADNSVIGGNRLVVF